jgi:flagellum-specific peptidoglycan hydrolase FlgJ
LLTVLQIEFITRVYEAAKISGHVYPGAAAAEAALESAWGTSKLCRLANNLFGLKKPTTWTGKTVNIATQEFVNNTWKTVPATWPIFDTWSDCLGERMRVLQTVSRYAKALAAPTPEDYIIDVSSEWATDPERAANVLSIYRHHLNILKD